MNIIKEFQKVRDIPYRIPLSPEESDECCSGKADMLFKTFKQNGYDVRYRLCTFRWSSIDLPKEIQDTPHDDDSSHTYLEIKIDGQWKIVDATWDKGLEGLFIVNEWDGKSDTKIAVQCIKCLSPEENLEYIEHMSTPEAIISDLNVNGEFYKAFNEWLKEYRESK
jgi:hypothetical protein